MRHRTDSPPEEKSLMKRAVGMAAIVVPLGGAAGSEKPTVQGQ
jgi:hypothetical protein